MPGLRGDKISRVGLGIKGGVETQNDTMYCAQLKASQFNYIRIIQRLARIILVQVLNEREIFRCNFADLKKLSKCCEIIQFFPTDIFKMLMKIVSQKKKKNDYPP